MRTCFLAQVLLGGTLVFVGCDAPELAAPKAEVHDVLFDEAGDDDDDDDNVTSAVTSLNALTGDVTLAAGINVTLTPNNNTITIAAPSAAAFTWVEITNDTDPFDLNCEYRWVVLGQEGGPFGFFATAVHPNVIWSDFSAGNVATVRFDNKALSDSDASGATGPATTFRRC